MVDRSIGPGERGREDGVGDLPREEDGSMKSCVNECRWLEIAFGVVRGVICIYISFAIVFFLGAPSKVGLSTFGGRRRARIASSPVHSYSVRTPMSSPRAVPLAWKNIAKSLPLRAILFDARCILRSPEEFDVEADKARAKALRQAGLGNTSQGLRASSAELLQRGKIKDMLQSEMRDELSNRSLSTVGKPWELQARLQAVLDAEAVGIRSPPKSGGPSDANPLPMTDPPPSLEPAMMTGPSSLSSGASSSSLTAGDARARYAAKLRQRTGGQASLNPDGSVQVDSTRKATRLADHERPVDLETQFRFQHGARDLLQYLDMRGIARVLLPSPDAASTDEEAALQGEMVARSLQVPPFEFILGSSEAARARSGEPAAFLHTHASLGLGATSELMLVSDDAVALRGARQARIFACHFYRKIQGAPKTLPSNYRAARMDDVQSAVEDLCGITYRDTDTEIKTKYGVSQT